ncbi:hypothetical protein FA13DRAFT_1740400 [Coprinellus micaceus]|uniref:Uncharacterized protein n=1 Tax=Coprinellus micaceus TaxID=71717 RepID=A0A4Y7SMJ3_COPMI|nr:hypothetical protein FA13DRAFT_1740400 [Coprinellus micaceus]
MSSAAHEYDEALLKAAPEIDKKQRQEGYSTDLLQDPKPEKHRSSTPGPPRATSPSTSNRDLERGAPARSGTGSSAAHTPAPNGAAATAVNSPSPLKPVKSRPFYKTRKGLILIGAVLIAIIIAAVVGGVVGSRKKNDNNSEPAAPAATTTQASGDDNQQGGVGGEQGAGGAPPDEQGVGGSITSTSTSTTEAPAATDAQGLPPTRRRFKRRFGAAEDLD